MSVTTVRSQIDSTAPTAPDAWPEEIVARYLVDITQYRSPSYDNQPADPMQFYFLREFVDLRYRAVCRGCQLAKDWLYEGVGADAADQHFGELVRRYGNPQEWAQLHAEKCRALPCPDRRTV
jgi:hypothetical protein